MESINIPTLESIKLLINPVFSKLEQINVKLSIDEKKIKTKKYYRNSDLKILFNLSSNTIIKYREKGVLPYTKLGDIFLYEVSEIDQILKENAIKI